LIDNVEEGALEVARAKDGLRGCRIVEIGG
jgi:hypothetical protein